jgi:hypothetical protein
MRIRFLNSALAAAFVAGLHTHAPEDVEIGVNFELCDLPTRGTSPILVVDSEVDDRSIEVDLDSVDYQSSVLHVAGLNSTVDHILRPFAGKDPSVTHTLSTGYDAVISRNGVQVGCKSFTPADMERIAFAAHRRSKGLSFRQFTTASGSVITPLGNNQIGVDRERPVNAADVVKVVEAFNQVKDQPATAQFVPFNLLA